MELIIICFLQTRIRMLVRKFGNESKIHRFHITRGGSCKKNTDIHIEDKNSH